MILQSFCPPSGRVLKVVIHPSDFGLQRMKEEERYGPQGIWRAQDKSEGADGEEGGEEEEEWESMSEGDDEDIYYQVDYVPSDLELE